MVDQIVAQLIKLGHDDYEHLHSCNDFGEDHFLFGKLPSLALQFVVESVQRDGHTFATDCSTVLNIIKMDSVACIPGNRRRNLSIFFGAYSSTVLSTALSLYVVVNPYVFHGY